jgi:hypothetical protein
MGTYTELLKLDKEKTKPKASSKSPTAKKKSAKPKKAKKIAKQKKEIKNSRYLERNQEIYLDIKKSRFLDYATPFLDAKPTDQQNFNYPPGAIDELEKIVLDLKAKVRKKNRRPRWNATKTTIYILAVLFILWDYQEKGEDSILHKAIFEER